MRAGALGATWIDKLEIAATPPRRDGDTEGPIAELRRAMLEEVRALPEAASAIASAIDELRRSLPPECRDVLGRDEGATAAIAAALADRGCEEVLARLEAPAGAEADACG